jgi:hypothetical protein
MEFVSVCYSHREQAFIRTAACGIAIDFVLNTDRTIAHAENNPRLEDRTNENAYIIHTYCGERN